MDNVTHTIAGFLLAEAALQFRRRRSAAESPRFARSAYVISALANNLPDIDFIYVRLTLPAKLGYLLHHRGHTHTIGIALLLMALVLGAFALGSGKIRRTLASGEVVWLAALGLLGPLVHIALDGSNSYGVHPFWPLYSGWLYGDSVFIIEPLFLAIAIPMLLFAFVSGIARAVFALILLAVLALVWLVPFIPTPVGIAVSFTALTSLLLGYKLRPSSRIVVALASSLGLALLFIVLRFQAEAQVRDTVFNQGSIRDVVLTPAPGNPVCWNTWLLRTQEGQYIAERGVVSVWPSAVPASLCPTEAEQNRVTAPLGGAQTPSTSAVAWQRCFQAPLAELEALNASNCQAAAFFRYARVPFWLTNSAGQTIVGDLRYDREPALEFAELELTPGSCPDWVPGWTPPRRDLLD